MSDVMHACSPEKIACLMDLRKIRLRCPALIDAFETVKREAFVPPMFASEAYQEKRLMMDGGFHMATPRMQLVMLDLLMPQPRMNVLHIGTGSGYLCALLSHLVRRIISVEINDDIHMQAQARLEAQNVRNVTCVQGDGFAGWDNAAPYDAILLSGAVSAVPPALLHQLDEAGRMVVPLGAPGKQVNLAIITRTGDRFITTRMTNIECDALICPDKVN